MSYVCNAIWIAKPGSEHIVAEALAHLAEPSRAEEGNLYFQVYQDPAERGTFRIFEIYTDQNAFRIHGESEHFATWGKGYGIPALLDRHRDFYETLDF